MKSDLIPKKKEKEKRTERRPKRDVEGLRLCRDPIRRDSYPEIIVYVTGF